MVKPIKIAGFRGMDNVRPLGGPLEIPRVVLNADVTAGGVIQKRTGYTLHVTLSGAHSLWAGSVMLCAAGGNLYRINGQVAVQIATGVGNAPIGYVELNGKVYMSSRQWTGSYDLVTGSVGAWGLSLPGVGPECSVVAGGLLAGAYHLCFTTADGQRIGGNGPITVVTLESTGGIAVLNRPAGSLLWCTDTDGDTLFLVGAVDTVVAVDGMTPLPTFMVTPPPLMEHLSQAHGRVWGARDNVVYYSEAFAYEWFKLHVNRMDFEDHVRMIAPVPSGLFLGFDSQTLFAMGTNPQEMIVKQVCPGVLEGTLAYGDNLGELGNHVPIWVGQKGIYAGTADGLVLELTRQRVKFDLPGKRGAGLFRMKSGEPQYLATFEQPTKVGFGDDVTCEVVRKGRVLNAKWEEEVYEVIASQDSTV